MPQIHIIDTCYNELVKIKADMTTEKRRKDQPDRTTFSEVVCMLICEYYSAKKLGEGSSSLLSNNDSAKKLDGASPPVSNNDPTRLKFDVLEKDYEKFLALNMKFYGLHQNDLDDVSIAVEDGKHVVFVETSFVPEYRKFMNENGYVEA